MKIIVRTFVIALALTGAIATIHANGSTQATAVHAAKTSAFPVASCPPDDPDGCGIGDD
ncbi:MAG: hypothetical protein ABR910_00290 [Acidobacteriaceae bacterium]|jgi:hypothetical protein